MLRETKIGNVIIVAQTTFYAYESQEKRLEDKFFLCTSNEKEIEMLKKRLEGNKGLQPIECTREN